MIIGRDQEADEIFSPLLLIGSLSCAAHLIIQVNILIATRTNQLTVGIDQDNLVMATTISTTVFLAVRFVASSLYAEMIHQEKTNSLRSLYQQSENEFQSHDLDILVVSYTN